jgi:exodeoxyribonuclease VII small subunit
MPPKPKPEPDDLAEVSFEAALSELESLVEQMETGELSLDQSLAAFERGVKLTRHCQAALETAELKVKVLTESGALEDLEVDDLDDD